MRETRGGDGHAYPEGMSEHDEATPNADGLMSRVRVIEAQPLARRAEAYAALHTELSGRLEQSDAGAAARPA